MYKVFYNKDTGQILGFSDGDESMEHPHVVTDTAPMILSNHYVDISTPDQPVLKTIKESFTEEEWQAIISPKAIQLVVGVEPIPVEEVDLQEETPVV